MSILTKEENLIEIRDNLSEITISGIPILMWQLKEDGTRILQPVFIKEIIGDDQLLLQTATKKNFELKQQTVYFHIATHKLIFKSEIDSIEDKFARVKFPQLMKFTEEEMVDDKEVDLGLHEFTKYIEGHGLGNHIDEIMRVAGNGRANINRENMRVKGSGGGNFNQSTHMRLNTSNATDKISTKWAINSMSSHDSEIFQTELNFVSLDDEDKIYAEQRESVRAKPKEGKMITIQKSDLATSEEIFPLYDLSKGGLAFLTTDQELFTKGEVVLVNALDEKRFEIPMQVSVMAVREADELSVQFKIGCAFVGE